MPAAVTVADRHEPESLVYTQMCCFGCRLPDCLAFNLCGFHQAHFTLARFCQPLENYRPSETDYHADKSHRCCASLLSI